jgi:D-3-phosphoglycerate dehydrogenase / 2-oxoglutarate reductase
MIDADVLDAATQLKVVARAGVGLDNADVEAATRHGVVVCNGRMSSRVAAPARTPARPDPRSRHG